MARSNARTTVRGSQDYTSVKLPPEWQALIDNAQFNQHPNKRRWTEVEDAFIVGARMANPRVEWSAICERLGCNETTARKRFVELRGRGRSNER